MEYNWNKKRGIDFSQTLRKLKDKVGIPVKQLIENMKNFTATHAS